MNARPTLRVALLILAVVPGCLAYEPVPGPHSARTQVKVGSAGHQLAAAEQPAVNPDAFVSRTRDLLAADDAQGARRWVERYPEIALDVLRRATCTEASDRGLQAIATIHDAQCGRASAEAGWLALLRDRAAHPDRYALHDAARKQLVDHLRVERYKEAAEVRLHSKNALLEVDGHRLMAEALLRAGRPKEAAATLSAAITLAREAYPYQAVNLALMFSDAWRRAGNDAKAVEAWKGAVDWAAALLVQEHPVADPALWEKIAGMRPVQTTWPAALAEHLAQSKAGGGMPAAPVVQVNTSSDAARSTADEARLWAAIGRWRLQRAEPQAALIAFKRAEEFQGTQAGHGLKLEQARALVLLNQRASAVALLSDLANDPEPALSRGALAIMGTLFFLEGRNDQALALLGKAVEQGTGDWPGRGQATGDLGLAYLTAGNEEKGLQCLHAAQKLFEDAHDLEPLRQCLENELRYLEHVGKNPEAALVRQRVHELSNSTAAGI